MVDAQNEVLFQKQVKHVLSGEKAAIASELRTERKTREAQENKSAAALMQLGATSLSAVEGERAAAQAAEKKLTAGVAKIKKKKLEAAKKNHCAEKGKREAPLAECGRLALELEDASDESDE